MSIKQANRLTGKSTMPISSYGEGYVMMWHLRYLFLIFIYYLFTIHSSIPKQIGVLSGFILTNCSIFFGFLPLLVQDSEVVDRKQVGERDGVGLGNDRRPDSNLGPRGHSDP